ncbi:hypothetical protein WR25_05681 [Diploscapter pachys]|uniref:F-box domain-containing protein n=1 Tax=Diploscapter pachys TaxID=2018661 RepID=A0A2A2LLQ2_9BILA|nr:hypothetical protein WR25_05681 [Diploscapter pachys]
MTELPSTSKIGKTWHNLPPEIHIKSVNNLQTKIISLMPFNDRLRMKLVCSYALKICNNLPNELNECNILVLNRVQEARSIRIIKMNCAVSDAQLLRLTAKKIQLSGTLVTANGINHLLRTFLEGKRDLRLVSIEIVDGPVIELEQIVQELEQCGATISISEPIAIIRVSTYQIFVEIYEKKPNTSLIHISLRSRDMLVTLYQTAPNHRAKRGWLFGNWVPESGTGGGGETYESDAGAPASRYGNAPAPHPRQPHQQQAPAYGGYGPVVNAEPEPQCCTCQQGAPGPIGPSDKFLCIYIISHQKYSATK